MKTFEVVVTSVEDVERVLFIRNDIHCFCIVDLCWRYVKECWNLCFQIIQCMHLDTTFLLPELRPAEYCKPEFDGSKIEGIDVPSKVKYLCNSQSASLFYHIIGKLFKDMIVPVLVRFCKIAPCDRVSESKELSLASVCLYGDYQVYKTVTSGELTEHKNFKLIPA